MNSESMTLSKLEGFLGRNLTGKELYQLVIDASGELGEHLVDEDCANEALEQAFACDESDGDPEEPPTIGDYAIDAVGDLHIDLCSGNDNYYWRSEVESIIRAAQ